MCLSWSPASTLHWGRKFHLLPMNNHDSKNVFWKLSSLCNPCWIMLVVFLVTKTDVRYSMVECVHIEGLPSVFQHFVINAGVWADNHCYFKVDTLLTQVLGCVTNQPSCQWRGNIFGDVKQYKEVIHLFSSGPGDPTKKQQAHSSLYCWPHYFLFKQNILSCILLNGHELGSRSMWQRWGRAGAARTTLGTYTTQSGKKGEISHSKLYCLYFSTVIY